MKAKYIRKARRMISGWKGILEHAPAESAVPITTATDGLSYTQQ